MLQDIEGKKKKTKTNIQPIGSSKISGSKLDVANPSIKFVICSVDNKKDFQVPATLKLLQDPCI
jgi:hypothetical protein